MKAIVARRGESRPDVTEVPNPSPDPGEVLLRTLRVGIDGTDHEVIRGNHGGFPESDNYQILGHEAVAIVEDPNDTDIKKGEIVVPTVRRPRDETNDYFERGEPDMAPDGLYVERGIVDAHGYMSEFFKSLPEFLVSVPESFAKHGFLLEPLSNTEKALEHAFASRSAFEWDPVSALVLGNGPLGLLTLAALEAPSSPFERNYCLGRRDRPDPTIDIIERLGGIYVDSRETSVDSVADVHEPVDFVYEATGYAKHAFESIEALAPNGVGALLGIPNDWKFEVDGGRLHRELVLKNKALFGSVNSNIKHLIAAKERLAEFPDWFTNALVTGIYPPEEVEAAFNPGEGAIKTVVEFKPY